MKPQRPRIQLIVAADEPALFFSSVDAAEHYLEAIDVRDGVYTAAYGPGGEPFGIEVLSERVVIRPLPGTARPQQLIDLLQGLRAEGAVVEQDTELSALLDQFAHQISA